MGIFGDIGSGVGGVIGGTSNGVAQGLPGAVSGAIDGGTKGAIGGAAAGAGIGAVGGLGIGDVVTIPAGATTGAAAGAFGGSAVGAATGFAPGFKQGYGEGHEAGAAIGGGYGAGLDNTWLGKKINSMAKGHKEAQKSDAKSDQKKSCDTCKKFKTQDEAGKAAAKEANEKSIKENKEWGGLIYKNPDGTYGYTDPKPGTGSGFDPNSASAPNNTEVVGDYHTHGDYSTIGPNNEPVRTSNPASDQWDSDNFSSDDEIGITQDARGNPDYRGYLGTPSGQIKVFNPTNGKVDTL